MEGSRRVGPYNNLFQHVRFSVSREKKNWGLNIKQRKLAWLYTKGQVRAFLLVSDLQQTFPRLVSNLPACGGTRVLQRLSEGLAILR